MTESARILNLLVTNLMLKAVGPFRRISSGRYCDRGREMDTKCRARGRSGAQTVKTRRNDVTDQYYNTTGTENERKETADKNAAHE